MEYGRILKRSLDITWRHKILWIFGILAVMFGAGSGGSGSPGNSGSGFQQQWDRSQMPHWGGPWDQWANVQWEAIVPIIAAVVAVLVMFGIALLIIGVIVRYTSEGALIGMVEEIEETEATTFKSGLQRGWRRFLRLFATDLFIGIAGFITVIAILLIMGLGAGLVVAAPAALLISMGGAAKVIGIIWAVALGFLFLLVFIVAMIAFAAVMTLVREYTFRASVLNLEGIFDAIKAGWRLFRTQMRESLLMWLLLLGINIVFGLLMIPLFIIGIVATALSGVAGYGVTEQIPVAILAALPAFLVMIGVAIFIHGVYYVFKSTVWTLTFRELESNDLLA